MSQKRMPEGRWYVPLTKSVVFVPTSLTRDPDEAIAIARRYTGDKMIPGGATKLVPYPKRR